MHARGHKFSYPAEHLLSNMKAFKFPFELSLSGFESLAICKIHVNAPDWTLLGAALLLVLKKHFYVFNKGAKVSISTVMLIYE